VPDEDRQQPVEGSPKERQGGTSQRGLRSRDSAGSARFGGHYWNVATNSTTYYHGDFILFALVILEIGSCFFSP
jgi:hypothetical protein